MERNQVAPGRRREPGKTYKTERVGKLIQPLSGALARPDTRKLDKYFPDDMPSELKPIECNDCKDTGWVLNGNAVSRCKCVERKSKARKLSVIPKRFQESSFDNYRETQYSQLDGSVVLPNSIRDNIMDSYLLVGDFGKGKTHLLYAQFRAQVEAGFNPKVITGLDLIDDLQKQMYQSENGYQAKLNLDTLKKIDQLHIFIDDLGKIKATEDRIAQLSNFINIVYEHKFGLTITSNLRPDEMEERWIINGDDNYAGAIVRRIQEICRVIYMF